MCHLKWNVLKGLFYKKHICQRKLHSLRKVFRGCGYREYIHSTNPFAGHDNFMSYFSFQYFGWLPNLLKGSVVIRVCVCGFICKLKVCTKWDWSFTDYLLSEFCGISRESRKALILIYNTLSVHIYHHTAHHVKTYL